MRQEAKDKIYELYYEFPEKKFTIREIEAKTKIPRATVQRYLKEMRKQGIVNAKNEAILSILYRIKKSNYFLEKIVESGLVDELIKKMNPSCIILFGSFRKGESVKDSDIDIFAESAVKKVPGLSKFEKKIGHKIDLFVESNVHKLQDNLFNNVVNGIKIFGSLKIK